jgi:hypothetical protein
MEPQIEALIQELERQTAEVEGLAAPLTDERFFRRTSGGKWSVAEHVAHLAVSNRPYLESIGVAAERARAKGWLRPGPYRGGWLMNRFTRSMEPPVERGLKTFKQLQPPADMDRAGVMRDFRATQEDMVVSLRAADGVDLGRAKLRSPFLKLLTMPVIGAYEFLVAHNRRHIWHMTNIVGGGVAAGSPSRPIREER